MNKTITINLAGFNFYIDELAYLKLDKYLKAISASLEPESREETMKDIEARIAELFLEKQKIKNQVIGIDEVDFIIATLGQPEDFIEAEPNASDPQNKSYSADTAQRKSKKLYRDIDHRGLGGVCAGLAHYLGIERIWVRLIFLLLFLPIFTSKLLVPSGSTVFLIYIIMWIVVPAARTTSQKLEMEGEKIDIDNIERKVRAEYQNIKKKVNDADYSGAQGFFEKLANILLGLLKIVIMIIGVIIVLVSGIGLIAILVSFFSLGAISFSGFNPLHEFGMNFTTLPYWLAYFLLAVVSGIPVLLLLFAGLKIINPKSKPISLTGILILVGVWVLALVPLSIYHPAWRNFDLKTAEFRTSSEIPLPVKDTLYFRPSAKVKGGNTGRIAYSNNISYTLQPSDSIDLIKTNYFLKIQSMESQNGKIDYEPNFQNDTVVLDLFSQIHARGSKLEENIKGNIQLKDSLVFKIDKQLKPLISNLRESYFDHFLRYENGKIVCLDCSEEKQTTSNPSEDEWYQGD